MDILSVAYSLTLFAVPILICFLFFNEKQMEIYNKPTWAYYLKYWNAKKHVKAYIKKYKKKQNYDKIDKIKREPYSLTDADEDEISIYGNDQNGNSLFLKFESRTVKNKDSAEIVIVLRLANGDLFKLPNESGVLNCSLQRREWKANGLAISILDPLKRYRVAYNGFMQKITKIGDTQIEHLKFNFIWHCASQPLFTPGDCAVELLTDALAREPWNNERWFDLVKDNPGYDQFGSLHGTLQSSSVPEMQLNLTSCRKLIWGTFENDPMCFRDVTIFVTAEDGTLINLCVRYLNQGCRQLVHGAVLYSNSKVHVIKNSDINIENLGHAKHIPNAFTLHMTTDKSTIKCIFHVNTEEQTKSTSLTTRGFDLLTATAECTVNSKQGRAIISFWYYERHIFGDCIQIPESLLMANENNGIDKYVVSLDSDDSKILSITGGKGNSLGLLTSIQNDKFVVPQGFVVTVSAYRQHIENNEKLKNAITAVENTKSENIEELTQHCKETMEQFGSIRIASDISKHIIDALEATACIIVAESPDEKIRWAVRSSGVGEDSEELSAAGQNSTFLGCSTHEAVLKSVAACWGSLFSFQSVQYRKLHGIEVDCDMGVVVQRMVNSDCAGVLFTCHPIDGNPSEMMITSNYGLGESVVSGHSDPDTITLKRTWGGDVSVKDISLGKKKMQILMDVEGTRTKDVDEELTGKCSLTEDQAILLGQVGVELENKFGSPRDIEWAFYKDKLYLLQSRPVTTLSNWTDDELLHELDVPIVCKDDLYTRANTGEVCPGAGTALTLSVLNVMLNQGIQENVDGYYNPFMINSVPIFSNQIFLHVYNLMLVMPQDHVDMSTKAADLSVFGHEVTTQEMLEFAKERFGVTTPKKRAVTMMTMMRGAWGVAKGVEKAKELAKSDIGLREGQSLIEMRDAINDYCVVAKDVGKMHSMASQTSTFYQVISVLVLAERETDFRPEHYSDIALLLSSCTDVVSAEIPTRLEEIASMIRENKELCEAFINLDTKDGVDWLKKHNADALKKFDEFLEVHGHRSFREFDLMEKSWAMQPECVIKMIQANSKVDSVTKKQSPLSDDDTISKLVTPKSKITRKILKFLVTKGRKAVANREKTKSELVRAINKLRIAYRKLATKMVSEGYLPNEELIFHLTNYELGQVIETRDPGLVSKAMRRQRLFPKWNKMSFPEMNKGNPIPVNADADLILLEENSNTITLKGTPVCPGEVMARACQITSLDDIGQLKSGDILITNSTDIGWSPYFPMLAGVVTELGGLISHGAVVAREYGLPCLVGVQGATKYFKTGDMVLLSAKNAALQLIVTEEKSINNE